MAIEAMDSLGNIHDLMYLDKNGDELGCGTAIECPGMAVAFYEISLDKKTNRLRITGRTHVAGSITDEDTIGVPGEIFIAQPKGNKLTKIRYLSRAFDRYKDTHGNNFPFQSGDFQLDFQFTPNDRLYFNSPLTRPREYNIGLLLQ